MVSTRANLLIINSSTQFTYDETVLLFSQKATQDIQSDKIELKEKHICRTAYPLVLFQALVCQTY
jgi:hypothetical protein